MSAQLNTRNADMADLVRILEDQHGRKHDMVIPATALKARRAQLVVEGAEPTIDEDGVTLNDGVYVPTKGCDGDLADKLKIRVEYLRRCREQAPDLYDANINGWLHGIGGSGGQAEGWTYDPRPADPRSFLLRTFRGDTGQPGVARALLSDTYGIMDHLDVLTAALDGVARAGVQVEIDGCDLTDSRMFVRVVCPQVQALAPNLLAGYRSPFEGRNAAERANMLAHGFYAEGEQPVVFAGFQISNCETGGGAFTLTPRIVVKVCRNGLQISSDAQRSVHIGSKLEAGIIRWTPETHRKALELITAKTRDSVATFLDPEYVRAAVEKLEEKAGREITDPQKTIKTIGEKLQFSEEARTSILSHFIRGGQTTAGGLMQAVTSVAQTMADAEAANEMEAAALKVLDLAAA